MSMSGSAYLTIGPAGAAGTAGTTWSNGSGAPSGGNDGDWYLNTTTGEVSKNTTGSWSVVMSIPAYTLSATAVTANTTVSIPAGYMIQDIVLQNTTANAITGGVRIGTTDTGVDVAISIAVGANALFTIPDATLLKRVFSMSGSTTLYLQTVTLWNSASINIYFFLRKVA